MSDTTIMNRRRMLRVSVSSFTAGMLFAYSGKADTGKQCTFSIGTYAMKNMKVEDAIQLVADTGYDGIEIAVRPDWDSAPDKMSVERRQRVHALLQQTGLKLTAFMEHILPAKEDAQHVKDLERLKGVAQLAHDLSPDAPPLVQTVLGGGAWEENKRRILDRVGDWVDVLAKQHIVLAVKPHRGGVMSRPEEAVWLIQQLGDTPWLRMVYDYSHYAFRDMTIEDTVKTALPYTAHIAIKDAVQRGDKVAFDLPGATGGFDYATLLGLFHQGGYRGDICCEVSAMVSNKPDYDPVEAAKSCYKNIAPMLIKGGIWQSRT